MFFLRNIGLLEGHIISFVMVHSMLSVSYIFIEIFAKQNSLFLEKLKKLKKKGTLNTKAVFRGPVVKKDPSGSLHDPN